MLDPRARKCGLCYDDQLKWGVPIPSCSDPDENGKPCPYPKMLSSLMDENIIVWDFWARWMDQLIKIDPTMAGAIYTLNLDFLIWHLEETRATDKITFIKKIRVIFEEWRMIQSSLEQTKTNQSFEKTRALKKEHGRR